MDGKFNQIELKHLEMLFDASNEGLWNMTPEGKVKFFNKTFYKNFEVSLENSTLEEWQDLIHPDDRLKFSDNVDVQTHTGIEDFVSEYRVRNRRGDFVWIEAKGIAQFDDEGNFLYMVGSHSDVTNRKHIEEQIYSLAYHDQLTGLFNRALLIQRLIGCADKQMLYFNLSKFRSINDTYGYERANEVLKAFARVLKNHFLNKGEVFRVDADEFAILMPIFQEDSNIHSQLLLIKQDFKQELYDIGTGIEIGINVGRAKANEDPIKMIEESKWAMIYGKKKGLDYCIDYNDEIKRHTQRMLFIETGILGSLQNGEFYMTYQPIVDIETGEVALLEALMRWYNPDIGLVVPDEFIPIAEKTRAIIRLGAFAIEMACQTINKMQEDLGRWVPISINISAIQLFEQDFYHFVLETLSKYQISGQMLVFEITESVALDMTTKTVEVIKRFKSLGIKIALDDFGSGFSSLSSLLTIPFDYIKIDKEIIRKMVQDSEIKIFIGALMYLCHSKGLLVVSEGIETIEMRDHVAELKTDYLQGYLYAKPMTLEDILDFLV